MSRTVSPEISLWQSPSNDCQLISNGETLDWFLRITFSILWGPQGPGVPGNPILSHGDRKSKLEKEWWAEGPGLPSGTPPPGTVSLWKNRSRMVF